MYNAKNYTEQGGAVTHIGGSLVIDDGAAVEGLPNELPEISSSDNGDVLTVVNGEWDKATPTSALPTVSSANNGQVLTVVDGGWGVQPIESVFPVQLTYDQQNDQFTSDITHEELAAAFHDGKIVWFYSHYIDIFDGDTDTFITFSLNKFVIFESSDDSDIYSFGIYRHDFENETILKYNSSNIAEAPLQFVTVTS